MNHNGPSWQRIMAWLIVTALCLELLASVLPRLLPSLIILAVIFVVIRLVLFHTRH
jgi:hypothetical protein